MLYFFIMANSTNSFTINVEPGWEEFIIFVAPGWEGLMLLDKLVMANFKPDAQYNIQPANSDVLVGVIDHNLKHCALNLMIMRIPAGCVIADNDPNSNICSMQVNKLKDWNKTDYNIIQKNTPMTWGPKRIPLNYFKL